MLLLFYKEHLFFKLLKWTVAHGRNQFTSVDLLRCRHNTAKQTPRSNVKSNCKQYHRTICTETTNL